MLNFRLFKSLFKSRTIAETLIKDQNILISMFLIMRDNEKNEWKKPYKKFFFKFLRIYKSILGVRVYKMAF